MENLKDIEKLLDNYAQELDPSKEQVERIYKKVMENTNTSSSQTWFDYLMNKRALAISLPVLLILFIGIPFFQVSPTNNVQDSEIANAPIYETNLEKETGEQQLFISSRNSEIDASSGFGSKPQVFNDVSEDTDTKTEDRAKIKTATFDIRLVDPNTDYQQIITKIEDLDGYIVQNEFSSNSYHNQDSQSVYGRIEARVPVENFDLVNSFIREVAGEVISESSTVSDIQNQLTQVQKQIDLYRKQIKDLEEKEELEPFEEVELNNLRNYLEFEQEKETDLNEQANFSTIVINFQEQTEEKGEIDSIVNDTKESIQDVYLFWVEVLAWLIIPAAFILPVAVVLVIVFRIYRRRTSSNG